MQSTLGKAGIAIASVVGLYSLLLGLLLSPWIQRFALYAHKFSTSFWHDVDNAEQWGFAKNQVTPFTIRTPDGEMLYAWHVLPIDIYSRNEKALRDDRPNYGSVENFEDTLAFKLLTSEAQSPARVVVNFHGNAGHVGQGWRTDTYRYLSTQSNTHVVTIDYRGFGRSTGYPTEAGLIIDATALLSWVLHTALILPENVVILGQSLGTAVASAVALRFADPTEDLLPRESGETEPLLNDEDAVKPTTFAGIVLVAPFSSLPSLMLTYRIGGFLPILLPFRPFPFLADYLTSRMIDKWPTADRLAEYYSILEANPKLLAGPHKRGMGMLQILHATNDMDITYRQTEMIRKRIFGNEQDCDQLNRPIVLDVASSGKPRIRFEVLQYGGHNRIVTYSPVVAAVVRAFEDL